VSSTTGTSPNTSPALRNTDYALCAVDDLRHFHEAFQQHEQTRRGSPRGITYLYRGAAEGQRSSSPDGRAPCPRARRKRNGAQFVAGEHRRSLSPLPEIDSHHCSDSKSRGLRGVRSLRAAGAAECSPLRRVLLRLVRMNRGRRAGRQTRAMRTVSGSSPWVGQVTSPQKLDDFSGLRKSPAHRFAAWSGANDRSGFQLPLLHHRRSRRDEKPTDSVADHKIALARIFFYTGEDIAHGAHGQRRMRLAFQIPFGGRNIRVGC